MFRWTVHLKGGPERLTQAAVAVEPKVYLFWYNVDSPIGVSVFHTVSLSWVNLPPVTSKGGEFPLEVPSSRLGQTAVAKIAIQSANIRIYYLF